MLKEVALILTTSLFFSMLFGALGHPTVLGYITAGVFLGPFVRLIEMPIVISMLGNLGMLMLLFIIGLEFDLIKFRKIWKRASLIVILQIIFGFAIAFTLKWMFDLNLEFAVLIAFLLSLSSTAIAVKLLEEMKEINTKNGAMVISILIVQDIVLVPIMLILKALNGNNTYFTIGANLFIAIGFLVSLIIYLGKESNRLLKPLKSIFQGNQETLTLASVAVCFGFSSIAAFLGLSSAYGAFLGGLILGSFGNKKEILQFALPISSILIMMFFISIGAKIDLEYIYKNWLVLGLISSALLVGKILMNYIILRIVKCPPNKSLFVSTMLSQASEFSFSLVVIVLKFGGISEAVQTMLNSLVIISLTFGAIFPVIAKNLYERFYGKKATK